MVCVLLSGGALTAQAQDDPKEERKVTYDFSGNVEGAFRFFLEEGAFPGQKRSYFSGSATPELEIGWDKGDQTLNITLFGRLDQHDSQRTHADIREFYYQIAKNSWEFSAGLKKVFWGVIESNHLVDVINQTDVVESFDGEQKLGQPMAHFSIYTRFGIFDAFALPYFRERVFPGSNGRLRPGFPVTDIAIDEDGAVFESDAENTHLDWAARWSHTVGILDIGVSHFYGTAREPFFLPNNDFTAFRPFYSQAHQTGLDLQLTTGPWLIKFEGIRRAHDKDEVNSRFENVPLIRAFPTFTAFASGVEYTFGNVMQKGWDIGLLAEYLFDDRDNFSSSGLDNDLFVATRVALNDVQSTELLAGAIFDLEQSTKLISVEGSRRFGSSLKATVEFRAFMDVDPEEFTLSFLQDDSFAQLSLAWYF